MLAADGTSYCTANMHLRRCILEDGQPWCLEALPGSRITVVVAHQGGSEQLQLSIGDTILQATADASLTQLPQINQDTALQMLRILEPAYSAASTVYPELTQEERHTATLQVSLQGKVCVLFNAPREWSLTIVYNRSWLHQ